MTDPIETRLRTLAKEFPYPPTPSVADAVMSRIHKPVNHPRSGRQLTWGLAMIIALLAGLMFIPTVRAAVLEFIQIGIVRIFPAPTFETPRTATSDPTSDSLLPLLEKMGGETTLENAQQNIGFTLPLPTYPSDLGEPDRVFLQDAGGFMVILVWLDPQQPDHVQMSLHLIEAGSWTIQKFQPTIIEETTIHGVRAIWTAGDYPLILRNAGIQFTRLINGHVLIWEKNTITYRLETSLELDEAVRVAESLQSPSTP